MIRYEHRHLRPRDKHACKIHLERCGYRILEMRFDTGAVQGPAHPRPTRRRRFHSLLREIQADAGWLLQRDQRADAALTKLRVTKYHLPLARLASGYCRVAFRRCADCRPRPRPTERR